jgi:hypothetical protein
MKVKRLRVRLSSLFRQAQTSNSQACDVANELFCESLETRLLFSLGFRTLDGTQNNLANPQWGSTDEAFVRISPAEYADGISAAAGSNRPSAREISNRIVAQGERDLLNDRDLSAFVYAWGQFLDHDIDFTDSASPRENLPISVPGGDPFFDPMGSGTKTIGLTRSKYDLASGLGIGNPRQQVNSITAFIDASHVYGSDAVRAAALRTFEGGKLKTSAGGLLPYNTQGLENQAPHGADPTKFYLAGDIRANENVELIAMHALFVREHNRLADAVAKRRPTWNDERIYQTVRRFVGAEIQAITYNEFLPAILGKNGLTPYRGYQPDVNPGIANEFATAAFRFGHSMLGADVEFLDNQGAELRSELALRDAFFAPEVVRDEGIDGVLKYLASDRAQQIDVHIVDDLRNFLFGPPGAGGFDLAALNIQRGRDHGLADYNTVRVAYGLSAVTSFEQITSDPQLQQALAATYGSVNEIDLWVGGLVEDRVPSTSVGPLFHKIIATQFQRLRDGDRFWYESAFSGAQLNHLRNMTLAKVIRNNTGTWNLQSNVFEFRVEVSGRVVLDINHNEVIDSGDPHLSGVSIELRDGSGLLLQSAVSDSFGRYRFAGLDLGAYRVSVVLPDGWRVATPLPANLVMSRGQIVTGVDVGITPSPSSPSAMQLQQVSLGALGIEALSL